MKKIINLILNASDIFVKPKTAYAHCDIPCGIYETDSAKWDAETVFVLTDKILNLQKPSGEDMKAKIAYKNSLIRMIQVKEKHAQQCKEQLLILWTDYFKPEHFQKHTDLSEKILKAAKQCSVVKRDVNLEQAQKLKEMVAEIAKIFAETKK